MTVWLIDYDGRSWEFDDQRLMLGEANLQKTIVGRTDFTPTDIDRLRMNRDGDAWAAALVLARMRDGMEQDDAAIIDPWKFDLMSIRAQRTAPAAAGAGDAAAEPAARAFDGDGAVPAP